VTAVRARYHPIRAHVCASGVCLEVGTRYTRRQGLLCAGRAPTRGTSKRAGAQCGLQLDVVVVRVYVLCVARAWWWARWWVPLGQDHNYGLSGTISSYGQIKITGGAVLFRFIEVMMLPGR
jgi:hypothetical protein